MTGRRTTLVGPWLLQLVACPYLFGCMSQPTGEAPAELAATASSGSGELRYVWEGSSFSDTWTVAAADDNPYLQAGLEGSLTASLERHSLPGTDEVRTRFEVRDPDFEGPDMSGLGPRFAPPSASGDGRGDAAVLESSLLEIADGDTSEQEVIVVFAREPGGQEPVDVELSRMESRRTSETTPSELRRQIVSEHLEATRRNQAGVLSRLAVDLGMATVEQYAVANAVLARIPRSRLRELARQPEVVRIEPNTSLRQMGGIDSSAVAQAHQTSQYVTAGYDGSHADPARHAYPHLTIGVLDFYFEESFPSIGGGSRIAERWDCTTAGCASVASMHSSMTGCYPFVCPDDPRHGTTCAQIANGLAPGSYSGLADGVSRNAMFVFVRVGAAADYLRAIDRFVLSGVDVVSSSVGTTLSGCGGNTATEIAISNAGAFYSLVWVQAAGNNGHSGSACTIADPADSTMAFAVGGLLSPLSSFSDPSSTYATIQSGAIADISSRGHVAYLGGYRSVIGTTAAAGQRYLPGGPFPYWYSTWTYGTSFAAPIVAGAAIDLRDYWLSNPGPYGGLITYPGFTFVQLLMMGDRHNESGGSSMEELDGLWGNGRFRERLFTSTGMDDPWGVGVVRTPVYPGSSVTIAVASGAVLPSQVDRLSVAMWWPEPNYSSNSADIVMTLYSGCGAANTWAQVLTDFSYDNHKRVVLTGAGGSAGGTCWHVVITPFSVPINNWIGIAYRDVWLSYYYEDEARDDLSAAIQ